MISFSEFLEEKLSRKDIDIGLSDPNVLIGLEFEFILNPDIIMDKKNDEVKPFEKLKIWKDFPFKDYEFGSYHNTRANVSYWRIEEDSSLSKGGVEVISPAIPMKDAISALKSVLDFIKNYGYTDRSCGLHVNMSYANKSFKDIDKLKLILFMDEGWVFDHFNERKNNPYAKSVIKRAIEDLTIGSSNKATEQKMVANKMFDDYKTTMRNTPAEKYLGINFSHIFKNDGSNRIEFRYLGGPDYDKKYQKIVAAMGRYSAYLSIAFDENSRKKEYIQKLIRIQNKIIEMQDLLDENPIAKESAIPEAFIQQYAVDIFTIDSMKSNVNFLSFDDENKVKINFLMKKKQNEISSFILLRKNVQTMSTIDQYMNVEFGYSETTKNNFVILPVK